MLNKLAEQGSSLAQEMKKFSFHGRVCAMKGLLQAVPQEVLTANLTSHGIHVPHAASASSSSGVAISKTRTDANGACASHLSNGETTSGATASCSHRAADGHAEQLEQPFVVSLEQSAVPPVSDRAAGGHAQGHGQMPAGAPRLWSLLSDGALLACCEAVRDSTDAHHKFHAVSALAFCLDRIKQCLQVHCTSSSPPCTPL